MYQGTEKRSVHREQAIQPNNDQLGDPHRTPSTQLQAKEQIRLVHVALSKLDPQQRIIVEMRNWHELSFEEIGQTIGKSAEASRKAWSRAMVRLERELTLLNAF